MDNYEYNSYLSDLEIYLDEDIPTMRGTNYGHNVHILRMKLTPSASSRKYKDFRITEKLCSIMFNLAEEVQCLSPSYDSFLERMRLHPEIKTPEKMFLREYLREYRKHLKISASTIEVCLTTKGEFFHSEKECKDDEYVIFYITEDRHVFSLAKDKDKKIIKNQWGRDFIHSQYDYSTENFGLKKSKNKRFIYALHALREELRQYTPNIEHLFTI